MRPCYTSGHLLLSSSSPASSNSQRTSEYVYNTQRTQIILELTSILTGRRLSSWSPRSLPAIFYLRHPPARDVVEPKSVTPTPRCFSPHVGSCSLLGVLFTWTWRKNKNSARVSTLLCYQAHLIPLVYDRYGCDTVSIVPFVGNTPMIYTRSMEVARQIVVDGQRSGAFGKSNDMGRFFL